MKNKKIIKISAIIVSLLLFVAIVGPSVVSAAATTTWAGLVPCGRDLNNNGKIDPINEECRICHLFVGVNGLVQFFSLDLATPLAIVVLLYAGFLYITSVEDPKKVSDAKKALNAAVWGMVITFGAWIIVDTVLKLLITQGLGEGLGGGAAKIEGWGPWNEMTCQ